MIDLKAFLLKLNHNLNILQERDAKYSGSSPLELINQIEDHKKAINLTEQTIRGELDEIELEEALEPLLVEIEKRSAPFSTITVGDVGGDIHNSVIAGTINVSGNFIVNTDAVSEKTSQKAVEIDLRIDEYGLSGPTNANFGVNELTKNLFSFTRHLKNFEIEGEEATSYIIFLTIPTDSFEINANNIVREARQMFDPTRWYDYRWIEKASPGYRTYASQIFPLKSAELRTTQRGIVLEEKTYLKGEKTNYNNLSLTINKLGEVSFATSFYTIDQYEDGTRIFRLGGMLHLFWSFLCLVREFQDTIGYNGNTCVCIAMVNTEGAYLGHFTKDYRGYEPYPNQRTPHWLMGGGSSEVCNDSNLLILRENIDLSVLEQKVEPEIIYDVAEEIANAFNQSEVRCFDKKTNELPDYLWPIN